MKQKAMVIPADAIVLENVIIIDPEYAKTYVASLRAIRNRMMKASENSNDKSFDKWVDKHVDVIDELIEELGYKPRA